MTVKTKPNNQQRTVRHMYQYHTASSTVCRVTFMPFPTSHALSSICSSKHHLSFVQAASRKTSHDTTESPKKPEIPTSCGGGVGGVCPVSFLPISPADDFLLLQGGSGAGAWREVRGATQEELPSQSEEEGSSSSTKDHIFVTYMLLGNRGRGGG